MVSQLIPRNLYLYDKIRYIIGFYFQGIGRFYFSQSSEACTRYICHWHSGVILRENGMGDNNSRSTGTITFAATFILFRYKNKFSYTHIVKVIACDCWQKKHVIFFSVRETFALVYNFSLGLHFRHYNYLLVASVT